MARLMLVAGRPVHRRHIVPLSSDGKPSSARSADVQISRLREKARRCGLERPVLAVRQWGYLFAVPPSAVAIESDSTIAARDTDCYMPTEAE
jgi:DNA-binding response OmpR family regulator